MVIDRRLSPNNECKRKEHAQGAQAGGNQHDKSIRGTGRRMKKHCSENLFSQPDVKSHVETAMISRRSLLLAALPHPSRRIAWVPGGTFRMGIDSDALEKQFPAPSNGLRSMLVAETPAHQVNISPFWMDRFAVTNVEFQRFTRSRPEWRKNRVGGDYLHHWDGDDCPANLRMLPVVFVSWHAAVAYAAWAGKRLPTEAEWEFTARGGLPNPKYPWGNEEPNPTRANYRASGVGRPVPVGTYPPNPYGVFDLVGNVWQFCLDPWLPYSNAPVQQSEEDLRGMRLRTAERRSIRGGSFDAVPFNLRVTARDSHRADHPVAHVGFRCVRSA